MKRINSALISVFDKEGLDPILNELSNLNIEIFSTGGTQSFIEEKGFKVTAVESLTDYPSILGGRVKTLHPKVFGGILSRRNLEDDTAQLAEYDIPEIDLLSQVGKVSEGINKVLNIPFSLSQNFPGVE